MKKLLFALGCATLVASTAFVSKKKTKKLPKVLKEQYSYIPSGNVLVGEDTLSVNAFYIANFEVSCSNYAEFINDLKTNGKTKELAIAQLDTVKWNKDSGDYMNSFVEIYHTHPAYGNYPVVNITYEGAQLYCKWLTEKTNKVLDGTIEVRFRLPVKEEWIRASRGDNLKASYAGGAPYLRNSKGAYLCNFKRIGNEQIKSVEDGKLEITYLENAGIAYKKDLHFVTAPVNAYYPNTFGLYNMNGNVAEMIYQKGTAMGGSWSSTGYNVRNVSEETFTSAQRTIGFRPVMVFERK